MLSKVNILVRKMRFLSRTCYGVGITNPTSVSLIYFFVVLILSVVSVDLSIAANIKVVPSATRVSPGENFYIDIVTENIPSTGLGAVQFRLNVDAPGSPVNSVADVTYGRVEEISVATPLVIGPPTSSRSGIGDFFWNGTGPHGILLMDNESLTAGSGLYTFSHTNGSIPPSGSGSVARFHFAVGKDVIAEKIVITLSEVMLLDSGTVYPLDSNTGTIIELRCITNIPDLIGLSRYDAEVSLGNSRLSVGSIYEIDNQGGNYPLNKVLVQSYMPGTSVLCETTVDLAINTAPLDVGSPNATDKANDESGAIILSWIPSISTDTTGYRIYNISISQTLLKEIRDPASTGIEITGLSNGQPLQIRITAFDNFGNESYGVIVSVTPLDDVAPRITIEGVADGAYYATDVLPVITVQDANLSTKEITLNGIPYNMTAISLEGNYILRVGATDTSGNTTTREISFVIDKTPPVITVAGIEKGRYYNTDLSPVITVTDLNLQKVESFLNGNLYTSGSFIITEGAYELRIEAIDKAGNRSSDIYTFYIDKTKPISSISIGEPKFESSGNIFVTGSTSFTLTGNDEGIVISGLERLEYRINNGIWNIYQMAFTLSGINDGAVTIDYRAIDRAGNIEDLHTLTVRSDNTPPVTTLILGEPKYINSTGMTYVTKDTLFTLSATDNLSGVFKTEYRIDNGEWISYAPFKISAEGSHTISYRSKDNLGNLEAEKVQTVITDNTPPVTTISGSDPLIDGVINTVSLKTRFTLSATDNLSGVKEIRYRIDSGSWQKYTNSFSLSGAGEHTITYKAIDNVLNEETEKSIKVRLIMLEVEKGLSTEPVVLVGVWGDDSDQGQKQTDINNLISILSSLNIDYFIGSSIDDFTSALRSGRYNSYLLIDLKEPLIGEEIREAVNHGDGLVFVKTNPQADPFFDDLFGVKFTGKTTSSDLTVTLLESPISQKGTIQSRGKNAVATINSNTSQIFGYVIDKNNTYPSIVFNQYGRGRTILYNFDLLYGGDQSKVADLILNSLNYVKPQEYHIKAFDSLPVRIKITNSTEPVDLRIIETIPSGTGADTVFPESIQTENTITWQKSLSSNEKAIFGYYLNLPDQKGDYTINTEIRYNNYGNYRLYGDYSLTVSVQNNSVELLQGIISELNSIPLTNTEDADRVVKAIENLSSINTNASSKKEAEQNIRFIIKAINEVRSLSFDASEIRLKLDELLKVWEMKWYLME